jgi:hypothetical protein
MDLLKNADLLRKEADSVIAFSHLKERLSKVGVLFVVGSYALDVMYRRDIDFVVIPKKISKNEVFELANELMKSDIFSDISISNKYDNRAKPYPKAFTLELWITHQKKDWKIDIWYTKNKSFSINTTKSYLKLLQNNPKGRLKILKMKEKLFDGTKYKRGMNGNEIYKKVLGK